MTKNVAFSSQDLSQRRVQQMSVPLTPEIYHWYQHMQQSHAVFFDTARSAWLVFRYDDVQRVLVDTQTFSSQREINPDGTVASIMGSGIIGMDPPRHRQLRTLISQAFTPHTVAKLEARITSIANALLDQVEARGKMDIVDDLAFPLPIAVIAELRTYERPRFLSCLVS
jgi:cytochrome P450